jgi:pimeloyl-ACP methyl ester carboxylesterase
MAILISTSISRRRRRNLRAILPFPPSLQPQGGATMEQFSTVTLIFWMIVVVMVGALVALAFVNRSLAKQAERDNPPAGRFLDINGVRLHFIERGEGEPLVLLHGNGTMIQDFEVSGLVERAAGRYRVVVFDRPGFGYSDRPRGTIWTPAAQAELIHRALEELQITQAVVLGHSWGASVAVALALQYPQSVRSLILASGYYYPTPRADVVFMSGPAVPLIGDIIRYTVAPVMGRLTWNVMMRRVFGPAPIPAKFRRFPAEMSLRPWQIRSSAAESALLIPDAFAMREQYPKLRLPVVIVAGEDDQLIKMDNQSGRLHRALDQSSFHAVPGAGHMIHQTHTDEVMAAIDEAAAVATRHYA